MARINLETRIFKEQGFQDLMIAVQSRHAAKGIVWELFDLAQEFWFPNRNPIPFDRFRAAGLPEVLFAPGGLAEKTENGIFVRGSEKAFQWLFDAQAAGTKSAEMRRAKKEKENKPSKPKKKKTSSTTVQPPLNDLEPELNEPEGVSTSLLSSPSSLLSIPNSFLPDDCDGLKEPHAPAENGPSPVTLVWRAYREAFAKRYNTAPTWNKRTAGQLKHFVDRVPTLEAPLIAAYYVAHNGARYVGAAHSVGAMLMDAEKLRMEWQTGTKVTTQDARHAEAGDALRNQIRRLGGGNT